MEVINKRARADYTIGDVFDAGILLLGHEAKSLRLGKASLKGSFVKITGGEAFVHNMHIQPYSYARLEGYEPTQTRKLLLKKKELLKLEQWSQRKGISLIPLKVYFAHNLLKLQFGVGKGKHEYEKREDLKKRDIDRELKIQFKQSVLR